MCYAWGTFKFCFLKCKYTLGEMLPMCFWCTLSSSVALQLWFVSEKQSELLHLSSPSHTHFFTYIYNVTIFQKQMNSATSQQTLISPALLRCASWNWWRGTLVCLSNFAAGHKFTQKYNSRCTSLFPGKGKSLCSFLPAFSFVFPMFAFQFPPSRQLPRGTCLQARLNLQSHQKSSNVTKELDPEWRQHTCGIYTKLI